MPLDEARSFLKVASELTVNRLMSLKKKLDVISEAFDGKAVQVDSTKDALAEHVQIAISEATKDLSEADAAKFVSIAEELVVESIWRFWMQNSKQFLKASLVQEEEKSSSSKSRVDWESVDCIGRSYKRHGWYRSWAFSKLLQKNWLWNHLKTSKQSEDNFWKLQFIEENLKK